MITPLEYFKTRKHACYLAKEFCNQFNTMREAWMDGGARIEWMLWAVGERQAHVNLIHAFAAWCVSFGTDLDTASGFISASELQEYYDSVVEECDSIEAADYAGELAVRLACEFDCEHVLRNALRWFFPNQFL